jgi:hypothetical protein
MEWLWIFLRYLFTRDHLRQGAEALRHRVAQLIHIAKDEAQLAQLLIDPALRRHLEFMILDAEDCLRLWIAMRGCQIAKQRPGAPHRRAAPHLSHAKDLPDLLARIDALAAACDAMEQRAQAHAARLKQMRDADPLGAHGSTGAARCAAAHHEAVGVSKSKSGLMVSSNGMLRIALRPSNHEAVLTARAATRGPPHSIEGANP